ncbi:MAG: flavodoxin family protein [Desulfuromonadales bacterium]|nr:flavodoxin family protein [Desulfuromonadales bacterium]
MKILGISGSPRPGKTTDQLVREVLRATDAPVEFVSLAGMRIGPCTGCLGCVNDNICKVKDDMAALREKIVAADALVIGAPNYFDMLNGLSHSFLERFYQFRHREGGVVSGKLGVAVGVGGGAPEPAARAIEKFFEFNQLECIGRVLAIGPASCFDCGYGENCTVGAIHHFYGPGTKITEEITPRLARQPQAVDQARDLGRTLRQRLSGVSRQGHLETAPKGKDADDATNS